MANSPSLAGLLPEQLCHTLSLSPSFRGRQVFQWIARGATSFDEMTNLDKKSRGRLAHDFCLRKSAVSQKLTDSDGTVKLQLTLHDGRAVETVLLTDREGRKTACVSSQAGCAMGCAFCQTGQLGLGRNLEAGEIVEQFLELEAASGLLDNIVFMGMGEPLQNLDAVSQAVAVLTHPEGRALSGRRITISTCGLIEKLYELSERALSVRLAVSLTTADQALRERLMPVAKANPLPELKKAIACYASRSGRRVTLEAALLGGLNTDEKSAEQLAMFASGMDVYVNVIPWNPVPGLPFVPPSFSECRGFVHFLEERGISAGLRMRRGASIAGACGQLGRAQAEQPPSGI